MQRKDLKTFREIGRIAPASAPSNLTPRLQREAPERVRWGKVGNGTKLGAQRADEVSD